MECTCSCSRAKVFQPVCCAELPLHFSINLYIKPLLHASWGADLGHTFSAKTY